ncbi:condensation domain-containing protein, partial [Burkholderia gladioli]|uniref:condensation domain-containing protein n=1 Tax=Burkholderia gladioli TaxID=28095 RepID=UPI003F7977FA
MTTTRPALALDTRELEQNGTRVLVLSPAGAGGEAAAVPALVPVPRGGDLPLSFAQQRLWFLSQLDGVKDTYHVPLAIRLRGALDVDAWRRALERVYARHEALRTVFAAPGGQPRARLLPAE